MQFKTLKLSIYKARATNYPRIHLVERDSNIAENRAGGFYSLEYMVDVSSAVSNTVSATIFLLFDIESQDSSLTAMPFHPLPSTKAN